MVDALAETFGLATFDAHAYTDTSDEALLELVTKLGRESGEFHGAVHDALKARRFEPQQMRLIRAEALDMVSALMTLLSRLESYVDAQEAGH